MGASYSLNKELYAEHTRIQTKKLIKL